MIRFVVDQSEILTLIISPEFRRPVMVAALMKQAIRPLRTNCTKKNSEVSKHDQAASRLYQLLKFRSVSRYKICYATHTISDEPGNYGENALVMQPELV